MKREFDGLENKLKGVNIGNILLLQNEVGDMAAGFVRQLTPLRVRLSHESPANIELYGNKYFPRLTVGDREYLLKEFNQYKVMDTNFTSD